MLWSIRVTKSSFYPVILILITGELHYSVSLLTALRIWVSLPDEPGTTAGNVLQQTGRREHVTGSSGRETAACNIYCNCSVQRMSSGRLMQVSHYQDEVKIN